MNESTENAIVDAIKLVILVMVIFFSIYSITKLSNNCNNGIKYEYRINKLQKEIDCLKKEICKCDKK